MRTTLFVAALATALVAPALSASCSVNFTDTAEEKAWNSWLKRGFTECTDTASAAL
jgi:hypothetical protein